MAAKVKGPSEQAVVEIDRALTEIKKDEPSIDLVETGLKQAKTLGVPVELEGPKPPASALAVTKTGFGPGSVAAKKPVPPPKPVPAVPAAAKAGAAKPKVAGGAPAAKAAGPVPAGPVPAGAGGAAGPAAPAPIAADMRLQPPVAPVGTRPEEDPAFVRVTGGVKGVAKDKKSHPTAASKAQEAQGAALAPTDDMAGQAKAAKVDKMDSQQAGTFDKKAFIAAVKTAIEAKAPKNLKEACDPSASKAGEVKGEVKGMVGQGKDDAAHDIEASAEAAPDQSKSIAKPVTPMSQENPGAAPAIPADGAVPKPAPAEQTNLEAGKHEVDQEMADANVTDEQLAKSNEPEFQGALADKQKAAQHAKTAPAEYRQQEKATLAQGREQAEADTKGGVAAMQGAKGAAMAKLMAAKGTTKSKDEQKRADVTNKIQGIFAATEADVKKTLEGIDPKVDAAFEKGEAGAKQAFESYVSAKMSAYKADRYSGWLGGLRWAKDKLLGMPDKVNEFYVAGREIYLKQMDGVIANVADIVGNDLKAAKDRIAKGRGEIAAYVKTLSPDLRKVGADAAKEIGDKFEQLESDVDNKQNEVVESLATKYVEARKGLDERIEELQAENKGLVDKAIGAIKAVINTIRELVTMLKNTLARAAAAISDIIKDPIGFLGNLIGAIKGGINKFFANIGTHLKKGLMGWLFGQLGEAGIEIPDTFDVKGIIKLLASIFGLTWANIRNRIVKQIGEKAMAAIEKGVDIFQKIASGGIGAIWEMLVEKLGDIKNMIMEQIQDFVITKIITAGITWLISLLNPAAAFIKACKLIYDVVMFFVNNAARIMKFVNTVIDGVVDIAKGNVSAVVNKIEDALGQMVPILIGFIASVLGIGGIGEKIKSIIQAIQRPFNKAIDFVIKKGLKVAGPVIRGLKGLGAKAKAGANKLKNKALAKIRGGDDSAEGKRKRLALGMQEGVAAANRFAGKTVGDQVLRPLLSVIRTRRGLAVLEPVKQGAMWAVHGQIQRATKPTAVKAGKAIDWGKAPATKLLARGLDRAEITHVFAQTTPDKIKSAIMEGLLARDKAREAKKAKPASAPTGKPKSEFVAGRRIKSSAGAEFSDGLDVIFGQSDSGQRIVKVLKIYEAKASDRQMRKISMEHERYSRMPTTPEGKFNETEKDRLRREVIDDLIEQHHPEALNDSLDPEAAKNAHQKAKAAVLRAYSAAKLEKLMAAKYRERTTGQAVRNRERLSPDVDQATGRDIPVSLTIDNKPYQVVDYSPKKTETVVVLPQGVTESDAVKQQLADQGVKHSFAEVKIDAATLNALASEVKAAQ